MYLTANYENECDYCMAGHTQLAKMQKIDDPIVQAIRNGTAIPDAKLEALHVFAGLVVRERGFVGDAAVEAFLASADLLARGLLVISFYRGVWCPYCNLELQALEAARPAFEAAGASLVAVSPQKPANSRRSQRENKLGFPILSDPGNAVAGAFGLKFALPDYLVDLYRQLGNNLSLVNDDESWTLPMPGRFAVGQDGTVLYAEVNPDYTQRPEPEDLIPVLRMAAAKAA